MIEDIQETTGQEINAGHVISQVPNCITDRSSTELKVNRLLGEMKSTNIAESVGKPSDTEMRQCKCSVHPLLQFAELCDKEIRSVEKDISTELGNVPATSKGESITHNLIRNISKLFFKDGSGDPLMTRTYLAEHGIPNLPVVNFRGNRFNVLFHNAAETYVLAETTLQYLQETKTSLNFLDVVLAVCRALGILSKKITAPYWRKAAKPDTALSMVLQCWNCGQRMPAHSCMVHMIYLVMM
jgi:hypothetical protein